VAQAQSEAYLGVSMHVFAHCCASAKLTIKRRKRMRASRGAAPTRPTELRQAESWSGVVSMSAQINATRYGGWES